MNFNALIKTASFAMLVAVASGAFGQELTLEGTATGGFDGTNAQTLGGLTYKGSTFDISTSGGFYSIGGNAGSPNFNNLGSFTLSGTPASYFGHTFTLDVTFTDPTGILNGSGNTYTAQLIGQVTSNTNGGAVIVFGSNTKTFTFANATQTGSFNLNVNPMSVNPSNVSPVTGYGLANVKAVPEPASMFCIATGLVGVVIKRRKK